MMKREKCMINMVMIISSIQNNMNKECLEMVTHSHQCLICSAWEEIERELKEVLDKQNQLVKK